MELQIFELVDLFIRDSSLGIFESRLRFLWVVRESLEVKYGMMLRNEESTSSGLVTLPKLMAAERTMVMARLRKVLNILHFILGYYSQFKPKLARTIARLDAQAREKIKILIDVSKWTLQKFSQVKSNIDKTHRQLNKACKLEEEVLMQNIQSLVLTSSRKKYIFTDAGGDKLASLDAEKKELMQESPISLKDCPEESRFSILKQLDFFQKR